MKAFLIISVIFSSVLAWGYWHSATHASISLRVHDYGLKSDRQRYGAPHEVTLTLYDKAAQHLAFAHSIEPAGYILLLHPDSKIGDCTKYQNSQQEYADCYSQYSAWASSRGDKVRTATVNINGCTLDHLPVNTSSTNTDWWLWWVPHPHIGGIPRRHFKFVIDINTKFCTVINQ